MWLAWLSDNYWLIWFCDWLGPLRYWLGCLSRSLNWLSLAPRGTAHATVYIDNSGDRSASACHPTTAASLRVFAPGDYASIQIPFSFPACARRGPVYLHVSTVVAGTGVPGGNG